MTKFAPSTGDRPDWHAADACAIETGAFAIYDAHGQLIDTLFCAGAPDWLAPDIALLLRRLSACDGRWVVLMHTHPSGIAEPSGADIEATRALARLLHPLGARLHDHLIWAGKSCFSFRAAGLL
jgi:hypothetical protein